MCRLRHSAIARFRFVSALRGRPPNPARAREDLVRAKRPAHQRSALVGERLRGERIQRRREKAFGGLRVREQRLHLAAQVLVAAAYACDKRSTSRRVLLKGRMADVLNLTPTGQRRSTEFSVHGAQQPEFREPPVPLHGADQADNLVGTAAGDRDKSHFVSGRNYNGRCRSASRRPVTSRATA